MPTLGLYFGSTKVSSVLIKDDGDPLYDSFPYAYSHSLMAHAYTEETFYKDVFEKILKLYDITNVNLEIVAAGFPRIPSIGEEYSHTLTIDKLVSTEQKYFSYLLDNWSIISSSSYIYCRPTVFPTKDSGQIDYLSNIAATNILVPKTLEEYKLMLGSMQPLIDELSHDSHTSELVGRAPTMYSGSLLSTDDEKIQNLLYVFLINTTRGEGVREVYYDMHNKFVLASLLKSYKSDFSYVLDSIEPDFLGTLLNINDDITCLLKSRVGTSQLVDVKKGQVFILPVDKNEEVDIVAKGSNIGTKEYKARGGKIGLVIDTRNKETFKNLSFDENLMKNVEENVEKL